MRRCIIHVGMHKTGTSSIQQSLNGFADSSFVYADIDGHPNHERAIFRLFGFDPAGRQENAQRGNELNAEAKAALNRSIQAAGQRTYLISGEGIGLLPRRELERLKCYLRASFDEITVVAAVRPPAAYMASAFGEPVKQGSRDSLDISRHYRNYRRSFEKFDEVFGREHVRLWKYDPASYPEGCAVRDFCARLGIDLPVERIVRRNDSLSREALGLLFTYRKLGREKGSMSMTAPQNLELVKRLASIGSTKFRFSPDAVRPVLAKNSADIEWMERRLGESLHEDLGETLPEDVCGETDLLRPDRSAVAALRALLNEAAPHGVRGETPAEVAVLVHALRAQPMARRPVLQRTAADLIEELLLQDDGSLMTNITKERATALVHEIFRQMNATLSGAQAGAISYAGLGQFLLRTVELESHGQKTIRTLINFRPAGAARNAAAHSEADKLVQERA